MMTLNRACQMAAQEISNAEAIVMGASNGLSISEGFNLFADDEWFRDNFSDFRSRFGIHSVIEGTSYPYPSDEEYWGFWSKLISLKSFNDPVGPAMRALADLVGSRPCFVVTTNAEGHFQQAGFDAERIFEMEGTFTELACSADCGAAPVPSKDAISKMAANESGGRVSLELHPRCEICGAPMRVNMAGGNSFFQKPEWIGMLSRFRDFLEEHASDKTTILELGVGMRNPFVTGALAEAKKALRDASVIVMSKGCGTGVRQDGALCIDDDITRALQIMDEGQ